MASRRVRKSHSRRKNARRSRGHARVRKNQLGGQYSPGGLNLLQGQQYSNIHREQHGGALYGAPVGDSGMLPSDLRIAARVEPLDSALGEISGMKDEGTYSSPQSGGARRKSRKTKKSRKSSKSKSRKSKTTKKSRKTKSKSRKYTKKSRRGQRGGAYNPAPYNAPSMLLSPGMAAKAGTADFTNPLLKY